jgi:hypothetical protein
MASSLAQLFTEGRRGRTWADWRLSKCGASSFSTLSRFQITASASKAEPSWNLTPGRSVKRQRVLSDSSTVQEVAKPGTSLPGLSATFISQATSGS